MVARAHPALEQGRDPIERIAGKGRSGEAERIRRAPPRVLPASTMHEADVASVERPVEIAQLFEHDGIGV